MSAGTWEAIPGDARDIAVGPGDEVWKVARFNNIASGDGAITKLNSDGATWAHEDNGYADRISKGLTHAWVVSVG